MTSDFKNPDLMIIGDSLSQGCKSLTITADYLNNSYGALAARLAQLPFSVPDPKREILFNLESIADLLVEQAIEIILGSIGDNYSQWTNGFDSQNSNSKTGAEYFDNLSVAGFTLADILGSLGSVGTPELADVVLNETAEIDLLDGDPFDVLGNIHIAINSRFVLNPSNDPGRMTMGQIDWVLRRQPKNLIVHMGHNDGFYQIGSQGSMDQWNAAWEGDAPALTAYEEILRQLAEGLPKTKIMVLAFPKISAVANLMPDPGAVPSAIQAGYFDKYHTVFPAVVKVEDSVLIPADNSVAAANASIGDIVARIATDTGSNIFIPFCMYALFDEYDSKNYRDITRTIPIDQYRFANTYLKGKKRYNQYTMDVPGFGYETFDSGGIQSIDGMHPSSIGHALLATQIAPFLTGEKITDAERIATLREGLNAETLVTRFPQNLDALVKLMNAFSADSVEVGTTSQLAAVINSVSKAYCGTQTYKKTKLEMGVEWRQPWQNYAENQSACPLRKYTPNSLPDLLKIVKDAHICSATVRPVGSSHSWSDVCVGNDFMVLPSNLNRVLDDDRTLDPIATSGRHLVYFESGLTIKELNRYLFRNHLALSNMGGFDGQTFAGAASTSTHGSGCAYGPLSDFIRSIELVSADATVYRVEKAGAAAITDKEGFDAVYGENRKLVQDDNWFNAIVVSMGTLGLIYSLVIEVEPCFWLQEVRTATTWEDVQNELLSLLYRKSDHYELLLNPYKVGDRHRCLRTIRTKVTEDVPAGKSGGRNCLIEFFSAILSVHGADKLVSKILDAFPFIIPGFLESTLIGMVGSYTDVSFKVFNIGNANDVKAYSMELGFPTKDNVYIAGINNILAIADAALACGNVYHTGPISLRFVKGTDSYLSPQQGVKDGVDGERCMVEIIMAKGTFGEMEQLYRCENGSYFYNARPHWGQINSLTGGRELVRSLYPETFIQWLGVKKELDLNGMFDSPFAKRVGLDSETAKFYIADNANK